MDTEWKYQIQFAYDICCTATLPLRDWQDREAAFRFVRDELMERYVHPTDPEIIQQQHDFLRALFSDACGEDPDDDEGYDSRD